MSFIRKEDAAKAAKLGGAIALVFGIAAWRVVGAVSPPKPDTPPPETIGAPATTSPTNGQPIAAPSPKPDEALIEPTRPVLGSMIDPFRTIVPARSVRVPSPRPVAMPMPMPLASGPLPPAGPLSTGGTGGTIVPPAPVAPPEAPLRVTDILAGANATAVVESGKDVCVVHQGGHLPDGTEVVAISSTTVTLRHGGKIRVLDVGN